jgi:hypothetical protein
MHKTCIDGTTYYVTLEIPVVWHDGIDETVRYSVRSVLISDVDVFFSVL